MSAVPQPEDIYRNAVEEGRRRLQRPVVEEVSTALAAGFDIAAGITVLGLVGALLSEHYGVHGAHFFASIGFGVGFVFLVVGRGELFTENFLVPLAGFDHQERTSWWSLLKLWTISPVFNVLGGTLIVVFLTVHGVLPHGTATPILDAAAKIHEKSVLTLFVSAIFAGALITAMTWFVEGNEQMGVRLSVAWVAGAILALGGFNHVIVVTLELVYAIRFGSHIPAAFVVGNFFLAVAGNMLGGVGLVTLNRITQGKSGGNARSRRA
ncbi:MAG TPA: formate/nitrite transporter family protein [Gaiellaceae bacterium]